MSAPSFEELHSQVIEWARQRKILRYSDAQTQLLKTVEEVGELASALVRGDQAAIADAYGDILVTLIVGSRLADVSLVVALERAYEEIKDRKGSLNEHGVFVKDET